MCEHCFENRISGKTTFQVSINGYKIIIRNVPCEKCSNCGECFFSNETSKQLEHIISMEKANCSDITVAFHSDAA